MALPAPIGRQREVLYFPHTGHLVVLGTAGSGKTTLAILRAVWLATKAPTKGRTLLVTFNKLLSSFLEHLNEDVAADLDIRNYHHFARGYLGGLDKLPNGSVLDDGPLRSLVRVALIGMQARHPGSKLLKQRPELLAEELVWISRMGIRTLAEYKEAERINRGGFRVAGKDRDLIWELREAYREVRSKAGQLYDWHDMASTVLDELKKDKRPRLYKHIVIDEGQDFSPEMLRSLAAAIPKDGTITLFGDIAQRIYGGRISWRDAGLKLDGRPVVQFEQNYRNTKQIAEFALALTKGPYFQGDPDGDLVTPKAPKADGPLPSLVSFKDARSEFDFVVAQAVAQGRNRTVAVLLRDGRSVRPYVTALTQAGARVKRLWKYQSVFPVEPGVWVGSYYGAKGLEFASVILPEVNDGTIPAPDRKSVFGDDAAWLDEEVRLLYVGATRARAQLLITYQGKVTRLLDGVAKSLYQREAR